MSASETISPTGPKPKRAFDPARIGVYAFLIITAAYFLLPLYIVIITSIKDLDAIRDGNIFFPPHNPTLAPWYKAWFTACTGLECKGDRKSVV